MSRDRPGRLERLVEQAKVVRPVSPATRARVLKRARQSALLGVIPPPRAPTPVVRGFPSSWLVGTAAAIGIAAAAGIALRPRAHTSGAQTSSAGPSPVPREAPLVAEALGAASLPAAPASATASAASERASPPQSRSDSYLAELALLRRAQQAYASEDFTTALRLLAEHGRRFPNGRLAEEREALRVRALGSSGRAEAARAGAKSFAARFPRSVLLSRTLAAADAGASE